MFRSIRIERMTVERPGASISPGCGHRDQIVRQFQTPRIRQSKKGRDPSPRRGSLMALLIEAGIHEVKSMPVLNGIIALVKTGELATQMQGLTGQFHRQAPDLCAAHGKAAR